MVICYFNKILLILWKQEKTLCCELLSNFVSLTDCKQHRYNDVLRRDSCEFNGFRVLCICPPLSWTLCLRRSKFVISL